MKKLVLWAAVAATLATGLAGCNTVAGLGDDVCGGGTHGAKLAIAGPRGPALA